MEPDTLTLYNGASAAAISVEHGALSSRADEISAPLLLNSDLEVTIADGVDQLNITGGIEGEKKLTLTSTSAGKLVLSGSNIYSGGTSVEGGTLVIASAGALPAGRSLSIGSGGTLILGGGAAMGASAQSAEPVPEPGTLALLTIAGLAGLLVGRRTK